DTDVVDAVVGDRDVRVAVLVVVADGERMWPRRASHAVGDGGQQAAAAVVEQNRHEGGGMAGDRHVGPAVAVEVADVDIVSLGAGGVGNTGCEAARAVADQYAHVVGVLVG